MSLTVEEVLQLPALEQLCGLPLIEQPYLCDILGCRWRRVTEQVAFI
ncbi:hypothetical protein [Pseudomonas syringae]|nr:hypothetical protein [Pseudomonas syringae]